jgi:hypothetical protein
MQPALPAPVPSGVAIAHPFGPKVPLPRPAPRASNIPVHAQIPSPPVARGPDDIGPPSGHIGLPAPRPDAFGQDMKPPAKRAMAPARPQVPKTAAARTPRPADSTDSMGWEAQWPRLR